MEGIPLRLLTSIESTEKKWRSPVRNINVGDLVLVNDDTTLHRHCWSLVRVVRVMPNRFGRVHHVVVRKGPFAKGEFERDIRKLCLLETST